MKTAAWRRALRGVISNNLEGNGGPGAIRTPDPFVRSEVLYPTELRARGAIIIHYNAWFEARPRER